MILRKCDRCGILENKDWDKWCKLTMYSPTKGRLLLDMCPNCVEYLFQCQHQFDKNNGIITQQDVASMSLEEFEGIFNKLKRK